jgi:hypothetical protein
MNRLPLLMLKASTLSLTTAAVVTALSGCSGGTIEAPKAAVPSKDSVVPETPAFPKVQLPEKVEQKGFLKNNKAKKK